MQLLRKLIFLSKNHHFIHQQTKHYFNYKYKSLSSNCQYLIARTRCDFVPEYIHSPEENEENHLYNQISNEHLGVIAGGHRVLIIQPYIKWGPDKNKITTPQLQMDEAESLIKTLPYWTVVDKIYAPLLTFKRKHVLGSGSFDNLKELIQKAGNVTAIFFSLEGLKYHQSKTLKTELGVEIFDRYSLIIHIFRAHARTPEAKLQVALAEIPYIRRKINSMLDETTGMINLIEHRKKILEFRESNLKKKLEKLKEHRIKCRSKRIKFEIPVIAVVGYTNAGKTSLIKALTGDNNLRPRNKLFATLDTTTHEGLLPCKMKVLYVDTIGFIQNVPEMLIEPFKATLEDALIADVIIHVYDISHPDKIAQVKHVEETIDSFCMDKKPSVINVANKCDLLHDGTVPENDIPVISTNLTGIDLLRFRVQEQILSSSGRTMMTMRVKAGSPAEAWLYKETTVIHAGVDENDVQFSMLNVVTTEAQFYRFKRFLRQLK